jgi:hypothetical protein
MPAFPLHPLKTIAHGTDFAAENGLKAEGPNRQTIVKYTEIVLKSTLLLFLDPPKYFKNRPQVMQISQIQSVQSA